MLHKLSLVFILVVVGQLANGQQFLRGKCPTPTYMEKFDVKRYMGHWYEWGKYNHIFEIGQKCAAAQYGLTKNNTVSVLNNAIYILTGKPTAIEGFANVLGPGRLNVQFPIGNFFPQTKEQNYVVVGTDYKKYAVVTSCHDIFGFHAQFVWALTREPFPDTKTVEKIKKHLEANGCPVEYLHVNDQLHCPAQQTDPEVGFLSLDDMNNV